MSRDLTLYRVLTNIANVASQSDSLCGGATESLASFTDAAALRQVQALARQGLDVLNGADQTPAPAGESRSSVAIELMAKGDPKITVKAYTGSPLEPALADATHTWKQLVSELVHRAKVSEEVSTNGHA